MNRLGNPMRQRVNRCGNPTRQRGMIGEPTCARGRIHPRRDLPCAWRYRSQWTQPQSFQAVLALFLLTVAAVADTKPVSISPGELAAFSQDGKYIAFVEAGVLHVERMKSENPLNELRLAKLFADLDSEQFSIRHSAYTELKELGGAISRQIDEQLRTATSLEVQHRLMALQGILNSTASFQHKRKIRLLVFSPNSEFIALGGDDRAVSLWRASSARRERVVTNMDSSIHSLCFSPDGRSLAVGSGSGAIEVHDLARANGVETLKGHTSAVHSLAFSPDGRRLFSAGGFDKRVGMWNTSHLGEANREFGNLAGWIGQHGDSVLSVAVSDDSHYLAMGGYEKAVTVWDLLRSKPILKLETNQDAVRKILFCDDGSKVVTAGDDGFVRIWSLMDQTLLGSFSAQVGRVLSLSVNPTGHQLAVSGTDKSTSIWDFKLILDGLHESSHR